MRNLQNLSGDIVVRNDVLSRSYAHLPRRAAYLFPICWSPFRGLPIRPWGPQANLFLVVRERKSLSIEERNCRC